MQIPYPQAITNPSKLWPLQSHSHTYTTHTRWLPMAHQHTPPPRLMAHLPTLRCARDNVVSIIRSSVRSRRCLDAWLYLPAHPAFLLHPLFLSCPCRPPTLPWCPASPSACRLHIEVGSSQLYLAYVPSFGFPASPPRRLVASKTEATEIVESSSPLSDLITPNLLVSPCPSPAVVGLPPHSWRMPSQGEVHLKARTYPMGH